MLQRSIAIEAAPQTAANAAVIVRAGWDCHIEGYDGTRVIAETDESRMGLNLRTKRDAGHEAIEVHFGGSGRVRVPFNSRITIHAGRDAHVQQVRGPVLANVGGSLHVRACGLLMPCNAGKNMDIDCERLPEGDARFHAGDDLRFYVRELTDARLKVNDGAGYWEGQIGDGRSSRPSIRLKCGGSATVVTALPVRGKILGHIEQP